MGSTMANSLSASEGASFQTVVTNHGWGGQRYDELKKGTVHYTNGMSQLTAVHSKAGTLGKIHKVIGVTIVHGESDHAAIKANWETWQALGFNEQSDVYKSFLVEWQRDYQADVKAVTGQAGNVPMFTDQMSSHTGYNSTTPISAIGQLDAANENPGKIYLVGPKYFLNYADQAHLDNASYRLLGEYYGKVIKQVFVDGIQWQPLQPISIIRTGNIIKAKFHVPSPATKIQFDVAAVSSMPNKGFEYYDSSGTTTVTKVEIFSSDTVKLTLSGTPPPGSNQRLRYAYTGTAEADPGAHSTGSAKGNLRDNDPTVAKYNGTTRLYNWAVHFSEAVEVNELPSRPSGLVVE